jgi:hypothetical protein
VSEQQNDSARSGADSATLCAQRRVANAALCFGALLFSAGLIANSSEIPASACEFPYEVASEAGWTTDVDCGDAVASASARLRGPARLLFGLTLDLNRADPRALEVLPRIGPIRAAAIVDARQAAAFTSVADLARVRGIGAKTIEGLSGWVEVGNDVGIDVGKEVGSHE